jgi:hypothetical protein
MPGTAYGPKQLHGVVNLYSRRDFSADCLSVLQNASWNINNLKVYRKAVVNGTVSSDSPQSFPLSQTLVSLSTLTALLASIFT